MGGKETGMAIGMVETCTGGQRRYCTIVILSSWRDIEFGGQCIPRHGEQFSKKVKA